MLQKMLIRNTIPNVNLEEKPVKNETFSTGWLALWLEHLNPDQEDMSLNSGQDRTWCAN
jgi:hypothetical protein